METKHQENNINLSQLHKDLIEENKSVLEQQIFQLKQELDQGVLLIDKYVKENSFIEKELTALHTLDFLKERKETAFL